MAKTERVDLVLTKEAVEKLRELADDIMGISRTSVVEMLIRAEWRKHHYGVSTKEVLEELARIRLEGEDIEGEGKDQCVE